MDTKVLVDNQKEVSIVEKIPQGRYTREFREEAARLSLPKSTLENWVRVAKAGKLGEVGKN
ncbi:MAG: hypothetical protein ACOX5Z_00455 [Desulfobulbus sp.]|jgi:transposase